MHGGGSCEIFSVDRGDGPLGAAASAAARELVHRARRAARVPHPRRDQGRAGRDRPPDRRLRRPRRVRRALLRDGAHRRAADPARRCPPRGRPRRRRTAGRSSSSSTPSSPIHAVDWRACGLGDLAPTPTATSPARSTRWLHQLDSYERPRPPGRPPHRPTGSTRTGPPDQPLRALPRRLQARQRAVRRRRAAAAARGRRLGDGRHRRPARRPRLGADLPPRTGGHDATRHGQGTDVRGRAPARPRRAGRALRGGVGPRHVAALGWYDVFSRWKLAIVLEGSYAKFLQGRSDKPIHEFFGSQADLLLDSATASRGRRDALMRAWQVQAAGEPIDVLHEVELDPPSPGPGQVRIRVTAAGIGLPDVLMCRGTYPLTPAAAVHARARRPPAWSPRSATASTSRSATGSWRDDVLAGHGSFAEECLVDAGSAFAAPDGLTDAEAAGFWIPHLTGWIGLVDRGPARRGRLAGGARRLRRQRHRRGAARHGARGTGHRGRRRRGEGGVLPRPRRRRRRSTTGRAGRSPPRCARPPTATASTCLRPGRRRARRGRGQGDGPPRAAARRRLRQRRVADDPGPRPGRHATRRWSACSPAATRAAELDAIHAHLAGLVADGRLRNAVTGEVAVRRPARQRSSAWPTAAVVGKQVLVP